MSTITLSRGKVASVIGIPQVPQLAPLALAVSAFAENLPSGSTITGVTGGSAGSSWTVESSDGGRVAKAGGNLIVGALLTNFEATPSFTLRLRQTKAGFADRIDTFIITVTNQFEAPDLGAIGFSSTALQLGTPASGALTGAVVGQALNPTGLPAGLTIDEPARTWAWSGGGAAGVYRINFSGVLADSANSPFPNFVDVTIAAAAVAVTDLGLQGTEDFIKAGFAADWTGVSAAMLPAATHSTVCTTPDQLQAALTAARNGAKTDKRRIICDWDGLAQLAASEFTAVQLRGFAAVADGWSDNGGWVIVEAASGRRPALMNPFETLGVRGLHIKGVDMAARWSGTGSAETEQCIIIKTNATWPAKAVVILEKVGMGRRFRDPACPQAEWVQAVKTNSGLADQVHLIDCAFSGAVNGIGIVAKRAKIIGCDLATPIQDFSDFFGHTFESDYFAYIWVERNSYRNPVDGVGNRNQHMDMGQTGTSLDQHSGYRLLALDCYGHASHSFAGDPGLGGGTQGFYNDDHLTANNLFCIRRCAWAVSSPATFAYYSPEATHKSYIEKLTGQRSGRVPSNFAGDVNAAQDFTVGLVFIAPASGTGTVLEVIDSALGSMPAHARISYTGCVLVDPRINRAGGSVAPETAFNGAAFTRGGVAANGIAGKFGYDLDEAGTQQAFIDSFAASWTAKAPYAGKFAPSPATLSWTATQPPVMQASYAISSAVAQAEGNSGSTAYVYTVTRSGNTAIASTLDWAVAGDGANPAAASDFVGGVLPSGTLNFAVGEVSKVITILVNGDTVNESDEGFILTIANAVPAGSITTASALGTVLNDDLAGLRRDTYDVSMTGASSTEGGHGTLGYTPAGRLLVAFPNGTKAITNRGAGGAKIAATWTLQAPALTAGEMNGSLFIQCDLNDYAANNNNTDNIGSGPSEFGKGLLHAALLKTNLVDAGLIAGSMAGRRALFWVGTEYGWVNGVRYLRNRILTESLWARYPGMAINAQDYWTQAPPANAQDSTDLFNAEIPRSFQVANRAHMNDKGYDYRATSWELWHTQAQEGGLPFFAFYNYRGNFASARTNGGDVCQLYPTGSITGATLSVHNRDGSINADFGLRTAGSTVFLTRVSAAPILKGWNELFIRSVKGSLTRDDWISVSIGSLGAAPGQVTLDGNVQARVDSNDNRGTFDAPDFPAGNRVWPVAVVPATGVTEFSFVIDLQCDNAAFDALQMDITNIGANAAIRRLTTGAFRVALRDDNDVALGQITGNTTAAQGRMLAADGRKIAFYSVKAAGGAVFQQLVICNLAGVVLQTVTTPAPAGATVMVNPAANSAGGWCEFVSTASGSNPFAGKVGTRWFSTVAIDFTVAANRDLFLTGGAMVNLPLSGAVTVAAGVNAGVVATPFRYARGHAGDMWQGRNYGTGGDIYMFGRYRGTIIGQPDLANPIGSVA